MNLELVLVVVAACALPQDGPGIHVGEPPVELTDTSTWDRMEVLGGPYYLTGTSYYLRKEKVVGVKYTVTADHPQQHAYDTDNLAEVVTYWPTATAVMDNTTIAVAGKGPDLRQKKTIIEIWKINKPYVEVPLPPELGASIGPVAVQSKTTVFYDSEVGKDMVRALVKSRSKPNVLLVQFHDSGDLYELDYSELVSPTTPPPSELCPLTKVLSATPWASGPYAPELADTDRRWVHAGTHFTEGHVYSLAPTFDTQWKAGSSAPLPLFIFDHDMNGSLDEWVVLTPTQAQARGLADGSQYSERGLATVW